MTPQGTMDEALDMGLRRWLRRRMLAEAALGLLLGMVTLLASALLFVIYYGFLYLVSFIGFPTLSALSGGFGNSRSIDPWLASKITSCSGLALLVLCFFLREHRKLQDATNTAPHLHPASAKARAALRLLAQMALSPVSLLALGVELCWKVSHIWRWEVASTARVLQRLYVCGRPVGLDAIFQEAGEAGPKVIACLRELDGIVFLSTRAAFVLSEELRSELRGCLGEAEVNPHESYDDAPPDFDQASEISAHLAFLGLGPEATPEEIKRAYRMIMKRNHPDVFGHDTGKRAFAEEYAKRLNQAYEAVTRWARDRDAIS